jgi:N-hydroxyarylamine O-acetyltransferase
MVPSTINLDAYLARIGYDGPSDLAPTLETLARLQLCHATTIPFENLDVLLARPMPLDIASLQQKLIVDKRGGYCFEQNTLLMHVLLALGYQVTPRAARVLFAAGRGQNTPRTHLWCEVQLPGSPAGESWAVDVGIGGLTPTAPLRLGTTEAQPTPHDVRRIVPGDGPHTLSKFQQVLIDGIWRDVCEFTGEAMPEIDREVAHWWTSTNPASKFRQNILAALATRDGGRHTLATREYTHRLGSTIVERFQITSGEHLREVLATRFSLAIPEGTTFGIDGL